ncbi:hypothetical protein BC827DRAFT_1123342 [Russula dissimulans]|nr:hypothetical protein BC827DRAFT_1123342 [Russula dissimulans]
MSAADKKVDGPSHPGLFQVDIREGEYLSVLIACKDFEVGEVLTDLTGLTKAPKSYATIQCGPGPEDHCSLNSDLDYVNHSCDPNVAFDLMKGHVYAIKRIEAGDVVTFFYPSTEWLMDQPFDCQCGAQSCIRRVEGAAVLSKEKLFTRGAVSPWISDAIRQRDLARTVEYHGRDGP